MKITKTYKYKKDNIVYVGGQVPDDAEVIETMDILNAEEGFELVRIADNENIGNSVWLRNGDVQENYREEKDVESDSVD